MRIEIDESELYPDYALQVARPDDDRSVEIPNDLVSRYLAAQREYIMAREEIRAIVIRRNEAKL